MAARVSKASSLLSHPADAPARVRLAARMKSHAANSRDCRPRSLAWKRWICQSLSQSCVDTSAVLRRREISASAHD